MYLQEHSLALGENGCATRILSLPSALHFPHFLSLDSELRWESEVRFANEITEQLPL
jgi:hypothetical protein